MLSLVSSRTATLTTVRAAQATAARFDSTRFYSSTMHDNDPEVLEMEKKRNLSRTQHKTSSLHPHAPGWNERLASASEASVKADKSTGSPLEMQTTTVEYMRAQRVELEGEEENSSTTAYYKRDEVSGPLSGAKGQEEVTVDEGRVVLDSEVADAVDQGIKLYSRMTPSEENVKADRGEI